MSLHLRDLAVGYRKRTILTGLNATAERGELTVLLGPNGVGKSTLLRTLAGLQPALGGAMHLDGADLDELSHTDRARRMAVVLTDRVSPGLLTARELVGFGRHPHTGFTGALTSHDHSIVDWAIDAVAGTHLAGRDVSELSDGERQRVLTARALAQEPGLLLLDEPSAFLDAPSRVALTGLLRTLASERDLAIVVSTHELELALRVADAVWLLDHEGVLHTGPPEQLALDGVISATFDTDELRFDLTAGTFVLRCATTRTCRVLGTDAAVLGRALSRTGWASSTSGTADAEIRQTANGYLGLADGKSTDLPDVAAVVSWARKQPVPVVRRADPADVATALARASAFSPYFAVDDIPGRTLGSIYADRDALTEAVRRTGLRLGVTEARVAASTWQFGLAARLWSIALGTVAAGDVVADLDRLCYRLDDDATIRLSLPEPGGWTAPDLTPLLTRIVIDEHLRPLHEGLRKVVPVAEGLLWGNAAAALHGALRLAPTELGKQLLATPELANALSPQGIRRSCCLFYRTPTSGTCGDCPLDGATVVTMKESTA
ncbi:hypothetical protein BBK82_07065 [Lentzea guizhouensis]|uniref:ABC transporter domain-containing protein n=1 Tax=Lentzea guizhouensis TaxID=1586287 RepID=A0A1B2HDS8_9PSEU|nr:ATP-binding cassette domain-containing protein [Lentzea guizhouensis]ANZ35879.1 hypothetical protein BBK82_07065 [Lentzea guizhouensis]